MLHRRLAMSLIASAMAHAITRPLFGAPQADGLPLMTTGLEHLSLTVPNPVETARFYGQVFNPQLFRERDDPNRYYALLGTAYMAFGLGTERPPFIDHFCALVPNYNAPETRAAIEAAGITMTPGGFGMVLDPDQIRYQMLNVPGGLAGTIVPGGRISMEPPIVQAVSIDHLTLRVSDLGASSAHYRTLFGQEVDTSATRVSFQLADTRLVLETVADGEDPGPHHFCLNVVGLDRVRATAQLRDLGATIPPPNEEGLLRFQDPHGTLIELKPV
jgi:catechol 2,3-dioxygenase-like lactoylglutathione lyase family enzyme